MGYRTVVILNNDQAHIWENDPKLGEKIAHQMNALDPDFQYGVIVECVHADVQTLMVIDSLQARPLSYSHWFPNQDKDELSLKLIREAAEKLGYNLSKKPVKGARG